MWQCEVSQVKALPIQPDSHHHHYHQLVLGVEGQSLFDVNGSGEDQIALGNGCLLPSDCQHRFQSLDTNKVLVVNFDAEGTGVGQEVTMTQRLFQRPMYFSVDQPFCALLKALVHELQHSSAVVQTQHHVRALMFYSLYERIVGHDFGGGGDHNRIDIEKLDDFIQKHLHEKISVAQLADLCHISVSRFHAHFRDVMKQTPYQYVMRRRVEQASWLLHSTSKPIGEIARSTGFPNQSTLSAAVKKEYGASPKALRNHRHEVGEPSH